MKKRTFAILGVIAALAIGGGVALAASWDHSKAGTDWADTFPDCDGLVQSPVDVQEALAGASDKELTIDYADRAAATVFNNDHVVQADIEPGAGSITVSDGGVDKTYNLLQFHWHTPSENELSGYDSDAEVHFVHQNPDDLTLAVVGVLYDTGAAEAALNGFFKSVPDVGDATEYEMDIRLDSIIDDVASAYNFAGSLTTPPCSEGVDWYVISDTDTLSQPQMDRLQEIFSGADFPSGNARPVQRVIVDDLVEVTVNR